jgi:phage protein D
LRLVHQFSFALGTEVTTNDPGFRILAGGVDVTGLMHDRLIELTVTDNDGTKADEVRPFARS